MEHVDAYDNDPNRRLRHVTDPERRWQLKLWDTYTYDKYNKSRLAYRLTSSSFDEQQRAVVFEGSDYFCSPMHAIDSDEAIEGLLGFLSLCAGDTDDEYFKSYTREQIKWRDAEAEDLGYWRMEMTDDSGCYTDSHTALIELDADGNELQGDEDE
jgi:hypothetical protein